MARRPFDPAREGWEKVAYRRGDILDRGSLAALFDGADVAVHLAFAIFGDREETRRVNLEGSRNVFEAAVEAGVRRLVYASSVAAYGFHPENPQPLTEEVPARGSEGFYYSAQKAELEAALDEILAGTEVDAYVFRPCIVAGPRATMLIEQVVEQRPPRRPGAAPAPRPRPAAAAGAGPARRRRPVPARPPRRRRPGARRGDRRRGPARRLQPRRRGGDRHRRHRPRDRLALGPGAGRRRSASAPASPGASPSSRRSWSGRPPSRTPVLMDTAKARARARLGAALRRRRDADARPRSRPAKRACSTELGPCAQATIVSAPGSARSSTLVRSPM